MGVEFNWSRGRESPQDTWTVSFVLVFCSLLFPRHCALKPAYGMPLFFASLRQRRGEGIGLVLEVYRSGTFHFAHKGS